MLFIFFFFSISFLSSLFRNAIGHDASVPVVSFTGSTAVSISKLTKRKTPSPFYEFLIGLLPVFYDASHVQGGAVFLGRLFLLHK